MDTELDPYRRAVRAFLEQYGNGVPVMWETISPADLGPVKAYLSGVDSSSLFVLILGGRYGVATAGGYSPKHQEERHAKERHLLRLLFTLPQGVQPADGRLQDWKGSLYNKISGNPAASPQDLVSQLKAKLDQLAARAQRDWIKLGRCMFIGSVKAKSSPTAGQSFHVIAKARDLAVRHELHAMATQRRTVLATTGAQGWQADGLVRLYAIEEVARNRGGRFTDLSVGPATATGVRVDGTFVLPVQRMNAASVSLHGVVPLKQ